MDDDLFLLSLFTAVLSDVRSERPPLVAGSLRRRPPLLPPRRPSQLPRAYPQRTDRKPFGPPAGASDHPPAATEDGDGDGDLPLMACRGAG